MGATYTRQSSSGITDGAVIEASDLNNEFDQLLAAFVAASGHTHDGTTAEGGPITKLLGTSITIGDASAGTDIAVTFDGESADGVLTWMEDEDYFKFSDEVLMNSTEKLLFGDTGTYIHQSADGVLDLVSDTEIEINATTIDINGAVAMDGAITGATNITLSGELDAATLDISGNADIDGTTNLDIVDIDGAVQVDSTITVGADDQGYDVKFFGDTASAYMLWDTSTDDLVLAGAAGIDLAGNIDVDGTANLDIVDIDGAVQIDNTITVGADDQGYDVKFFGDTASAYMLWDTSADDLVLAGAAGIDLAGDIDVDGTANLDAVDIDGAVQIDNTVTVGVDDTGYDVKFFGATSGSYMLWDESTDDLVLAGASKLYLYDAGGGEYLSSSGSALTIASGSAAWELPTSDGSANQLLKTDGSGNLDWTTVSGTITALNTQAANRLTTIGSTTTELDGEANLTFTGSALTCIGTITVGVDDTGHDVKFFGATAGSYALWDESADSLLLTDSTPLKIGDSQDLTLYHDGTNSYITNSQGALKVATETSGIAITIGHTTSETTIADNATITGNLSVGGNFDVTGTLDFSDSAITNAGDIQLDSITGDGDTDTAITFSGSNVITVKANNADQVTFTDGAIVPSSDNDIDLGTSSVEFKDAFFDGTVTADAFAGPLTGDVTGNVSGTAATVTTAAQSNITSLGTLTTLTVDNVIINGTTIGHTSDTDLLTLTDGVLTVAGEVSATTLDIGGTNIGSTAAELNLLDGSAKSTSSITLADSDALIVIDGTTTKQIPVSDIKTYNPGGTAWQAVVTGNTTMVSGRGYFVNTTSAAITMTLPASPSLGDSVTVIDYAGTADSNNITIGRNSQKIHSASEDMTVATERAAFTLVFTDSTQGWLLTEK